LIVYWIGLDVGQASDYTALAFLEIVDVPNPSMTERAIKKMKALDVKAEPPKVQHHIRALERPPLRTSYDKVVEGVLERINQLGLGIHGQVGLAVDATGVGRGITDMLKKRIRERQQERKSDPTIRLKPVMVTGGHKPGFHEGYWNIPKRDLIHAGVIGLQNDTLRVSKNVKLRDTLIKELLNYRMTINTRTGRDAYEPWREGEHDDLLFSVCLAEWAARRWGDHDLRPIDLPPELRVGGGSMGNRRKRPA